MSRRVRAAPCPRAGGGVYKERLFALPPFLLGSQNAVARADIAAGLKLTAYFLAERVLMPHGKEMPAARLGWMNSQDANHTNSYSPWPPLRRPPSQRA